MGSNRQSAHNKQSVQSKTTQSQHNHTDLIVPLTGQVEDPAKQNPLKAAFSKNKRSIEMQKLKHDVQIGKIPLIIANSGTTSHCGHKEDPFIHRDKLSTKCSTCHWDR